MYVQFESRLHDKGWIVNCGLLVSNMPDQTRNALRFEGRGQREDLFCRNDLKTNVAVQIGNAKQFLWFPTLISLML